MIPSARAVRRVAGQFSPCRRPSCEATRSAARRPGARSCASCSSPRKQLTRSSRSARVDGRLSPHAPMIRLTVETRTFARTGPDSCLRCAPSPPSPSRREMVSDRPPPSVGSQLVGRPRQLNPRGFALHARSPLHARREVRPRYPVHVRRRLPVREKVLAMVVEARSWRDRSSSASNADAATLELEVHVPALSPAHPAGRRGLLVGISIRRMRSSRRPCRARAERIVAFPSRRPVSRRFARRARCARPSAGAARREPHHRRPASARSHRRHRRVGPRGCAHVIEVDDGMRIVAPVYPVRDAS